MRGVVVFEYPTLVDAKAAPRGVVIATYQESG
jgi:hypothetical protein